MKKALSIVEVLVSIILITIVIGALLKVNSQNAQAIINFKKDSFLASSFGIVSLVALENKVEKKYYISDLVNFKEDEIDKKLKELKFEVEKEVKKSTKLYDETEFPITLVPTDIMIINNKTTKKITLVDVKVELN